MFCLLLYKIHYWWQSYTLSMKTQNFFDKKYVLSAFRAISCADFRLIVNTSATAIFTRRNGLFSVSERAFWAGGMNRFGVQNKPFCNTLEIKALRGTADVSSHPSLIYHLCVFI